MPWSGTRVPMVKISVNCAAVGAGAGALTDGRFKLVNPMGAGSTVNLGPMARLVIGQVDVLVASRRAQTLDAQVFLLHGIDVRTQRIVALKSQQHFRGGFQDIAGTIIRADTPGFTTSNLSLLPFRHIRRPIWPLDPLPGRETWLHYTG